MPLELIDTHCHIHDQEFEWGQTKALADASAAGISRLICVGTSVKSSHEAVSYCADTPRTTPKCYFSLALHPHEATRMNQSDLEGCWASLEALALEQADNPLFVAIGECGLDYFYPVDSSGRARQAWLLDRHLSLAKKLQKPVIFHVREAYDDFWPIYEKYNLPGVMHSFSASPKEVEQVLEHPGLYFGLNGIMTFTKDQTQLDAARAIPLENLMLETDAPFLTPTPLRGTINHPANVRLVAEFLSDLRGETIGLLADQTNANASRLFGF